MLVDTDQCDLSDLWPPRFHLWPQLTSRPPPPHFDWSRESVFWLEKCLLQYNFLYVMIYSPKDWSYQPQLFIASFTEKNPIISHANLVFLHYWFIDLHVNPWTGLFITLHYKRQSEGNTETDKIGFKVLWLWLDLFNIHFHTLLFPMNLITVHLDLFITGQTSKSLKCIYIFWNV